MLRGVSCGFSVVFEQALLAFERAGSPTEGGCTVSKKKAGAIAPAYHDGPFGFPHSGLLVVTVRTDTNMGDTPPYEGPGLGPSAFLVSVGFLRVSLDFYRDFV